MLRKIFVLLFVSVSGVLFGQNLARTCVIDMSRIYREFQTDSRAVQQFEQETKKVQDEIQKRESEINKLKADHATAVSSGNQTEANRIETNINRLTEALRTYFNSKTAELERMRANLVQPRSGNFYNQLHDEIRLVAEGEGYSIVLDKMNRNSGIIWNSNTVDITDKVIQNLRAKVKASR